MIEPQLSGEAWLAAVESVPWGDVGLHAWWLGQMGFLVRAGGLRFVMDPYLSDSLTRKYAGTERPHVRMTGRVVDPARLRDIDVVMASHGHTDHLDPETLRPLAASNPRMILVCPESIRGLAMERSGLPAHRVVGLDADGDGSVPSAFEGEGWSVQAVPAAHEAIERDREGRMLYLGFVVRCGGWCWYHAGDTVPWPGMEARVGMHRPDVAFLPINGRRPERRVSGNLWGREAASLARSVGVRMAIPGHFEMFEFNTESPDEFASECARLGQPCRVLRAGEGWTAAR
jgi:L-ascorbate metabolism protein UlaG (beta-lactamase superfamily)